MKDWYLGNSWAGGIARAYANGRNQESSSESIAAYEAVSMYGKVMVSINKMSKHSFVMNYNMLTRFISLKSIFSRIFLVQLKISIV